MRERERDGEGRRENWVGRGGRREDTQKGERERETDGERGRGGKWGKEEGQRDRDRQAVRMGRTEKTKEYKGRGLKEPRSQVSGYT